MLAPVPLTKEFYADSYNNLRRLKVLKIAETLSRYAPYAALPYEDKLDIAATIESGCVAESTRKAYEYGIKRIWEDEQFQLIYHDICYNIIGATDIEDGGSCDLCEKIVGEQIDLTMLAQMSAQELCPDTYAPLIDILNKRSAVELTVKHSALYTCGKCKKRDVEYVRLQTRSSDEGSTMRITCHNCHNCWFTSS